MEYKVLGPIEVLDDDGRRVDLGGPKQRALLALLLTEAGRVVSLDRIIDELWGDEPPPAATGTLQAYVSVLRRALEPDRKPRQPARILLTTPPGYTLAIDAEHTDAGRFERAISDAQGHLADGDAARADELLDQALSLWRGEPLADVAHERFAQVEASRLIELRLAAMEARATARLALGKHALVIPELERMIAENPLRERLRGQLILALYRAGRQADALQAYHDTRRMLADELGIDPSPELQQLEADILAQSDSLRWQPAEPATRPAEQRREPAPETLTPTEPTTAHEQRRPFVGRDRETAAVREAVARARDGSGGLLLISGEAGIGKTSLAEIAAEHARSLGMLVAAGGCSEGQQSMWFAPWVQVARGVRDALAGQGKDISGLQKILQTDWHALIEKTEDPVEAEAMRYRFYERVLRDITARATEQPGLFLMDDLHWADGSSLGLLRYIVPRLAHVPLLIVATFRSEELATSEALDEALGWLMRERTVEHLPLSGLGIDDVASYLTAIGARTEGDLPRALHDRTDGNPFYMIELVRLLTSEGAIGAERSPLPNVTRSLPLSVQEVIRRRVARLPDGTRAILGVASVAGRDFAVDVVADAARVELDEVLDLLEPALVTRVLTEDPQPGRLRFSHALVRETVRSSLPAIQQARLHLRIGEVLEQRYGDAPDAPVAELAHHFWHAMTAGGAPRALRYAQLAGQHATASLAYEEAVRHWTDALKALEVAAPGDVQQRLDILFELGLAQRRNGDVVGGWAHIAELIDLSIKIGDELRAVRAAISFGGIDLWNWRDYGEVNQQVVALLEQALSWVPQRAPELLPRVLATLAVELAWGDRRDDAESFGAAAVELTRDSGMPITHARALNAFFLATWRPGTETKRLQAMDEYLSLSEHLSDEVEAVGRLHRMFLRLRAGDLDGVEEDLQHVHALAPSVRDPDLRAQMTSVEVMRAMLDARWDDVARIREELRALAQGTNLWGFGWVEVVHELTLARLIGGEIPHLARAKEILDLSATAELMRPLIVLGLLTAGRRDEAVELVARATPSVRRDWAWEFTSAAWGEIAALLGTPDAAAMYEQLSPAADAIIVAGTSNACWGSMHGTLGRLALSMGRIDEAVEHLRAAHQAEQRLRAPGLDARTLTDLGEALQRAGEAAEAREVLARAGALATEHGLAVLPRIEQLLA